jgi:hypothetical protein
MPQGPGPFKWEKTKKGRYKAKSIDSSYFPADSKRKTISDFAPLFRNLAQTSHFEVSFSGFSQQVELSTYIKSRGVDSNFIVDDLGLLCYNTFIPTASSTTVRTQGNRTGIFEEFAHARTYDSLQLTFYVDKKYKVLTFFESWSEFIHSGSGFNEADDNYFVRNQYPEDYKMDLLKIYKFDRDYRTVVPYTFKKIFPTGIIPLQVDYSSSEILKLNVTLSYERFITDDVISIS